MYFSDKFNHKGRQHEWDYKSKSNTAFHRPHKLHNSRHKKTHEQWLEESDYTCISNKHVVTPPSVINAIPSTKWAILDEMPRLYTVYRCKWGYDSVGDAKNMYCQNGHWRGKKPKCVFRGEIYHVAIVRSCNILIYKGTNISKCWWLFLDVHTCTCILVFVLYLFIIVTRYLHFHNHAEVHNNCTQT